MTSRDMLKVALVDDREMTLLDDLLGALGIVRAEDEDALAAEQETVHINNADAGFAERLHGLCGTARLIVDGDGEDVTEGYRDIRFLELLTGAQRLAADETINAVFGGVGDGGSNDLDIGFFQRIKHTDQGAGTVLDENGKLMNGHNIYLLIHF